MIKRLAQTMKKTVFIFDFDGTIADTHRYIVKISNRLSKEFNYKAIDSEEAEKLKGKTSQEVIRYMNVPLMKIPAIISKAKKEFQKEINSIEPFKGLSEILHRMKKQNVIMGILSSNSMDNIAGFLKQHQLEIFDFVQTTSKVWSKNTCLKNLIQKNSFSFDQILYIGDEIRDILAARKLGVTMAAVGWGYNSTDALQKHHPDFMLTRPQDLLDLFDNSSS